MKRDSAVASIIGLTVLIAAAITGPILVPFEFEMTEEIQNAKVVAITAKKTVDNTGTYLVLTNHGGKDTASIASFHVSVAPSICDETNLINGQLKGLTKRVNSIGKCTLSPGDERITVKVLGEFTDGTKQLLLDTTFR